MSDENIETTNEEITPTPAIRRLPIMIAAAVVAVLGISGLTYWYLRGNSSNGAGQPVSAPRTVTFDNGSKNEPVPGEQLLTIQPDQVDRIGLKLETVGETLSTEAVSVAATGVVGPNAYRETPVISLLGGVLRKVSGELGQHVSKGQTVAVIFSDQFAEAQSKYLALRTEAQAARQNYERAAKMVKISPVSNAEVDQALAALKTAEADMEEHHSHHLRAEKLLAIGAISREEYEDSRTKMKTATANLVETKKRYERAVKVAEIDPVSRGEFEMAAVKQQTAESDLAAAGQKLVLYGMSPQRVAALSRPSQITSEIAVTAPSSGTLTKRDVNQGQLVDANAELMRVTDLSTVWVIAQVYEKDLAALHEGSGATVTTDANPGRVFRGHVTYIDPAINPETRTAQVRIELENPGDALKLGMYVNAAFGSGGAAERTVPVIATSAVQNMNERQMVFVATDKPNVFGVRYVRLGAETNGRTPVLEGLKVGDRVVTDGSFLLRAELLKQGQ